ncbi:MAG: hypothetical protein ABIH86_06360 [Planctomycetota bacterium]
MAIQQAAFLLAVIFSQLADNQLSEAGFGAPIEMDGRNCRLIKAGARRDITVPVWWEADSMRPKNDAKYAIELVYKDTITAPAQMLSHGAIGSYHGMSVLHEFGGKNDGQWKTAIIPLSFSYIIRLADDKANTKFGFIAPADLPIESLRIRFATPADEALVNAEIRAQVSEKQKTAKDALIAGMTFEPFDSAKPSDKIQGFPFPWEPMAPLMINQNPKLEDIGKPIKIRMCLNEIEPCAFGIHAYTKPISSVTYKVSELKTDAGQTLDADLILRTAEYAVVDGGKSLVPQRLWPQFTVDIPANQSQLFWFNVKTQRGRTKPGMYKGTVSVYSGRTEFAKLPVEVEVLNIDLLTMNEANLTVGGCVSGFLPLHDYNFSVDYNQNGVNFWFLGAQPGMSTDENGKLKIDFTYFDDYMQSAKARGLDNIVWFLGGDPYGWPDTVGILRDLARNVSDPAERQKLREEWLLKQSSPEHRNAVVPELREPFKDWVRTVTDHARANNWPELILTPFDEPAKWTQDPRPDQLKGKLPGVIGTGRHIKPFFKDMCALIKEASPKTRIYGSIHHNRDRQQEGIVFLEDINVFCTNAIHEDPLLGEKVRLAGEDFWQYSGTGAGGSPDKALFTFGWYFASFNSRGSLVWAYNWGNRFDNSTGSNWLYAHHTPYDVIPEPYYEGMRDAWDVRRLIETYKRRRMDNMPKIAELEAILKEAAASRGAGGRDTVNDFWAAIDDIKKLHRWRDALLDELAK